MKTFLKYFYEILSQFFSGFGSIINGFIDGFKKIFNFKKLRLLQIIKVILMLVNGYYLEYQSFYYSYLWL